MVMGTWLVIRVKTEDPVEVDVTGHSGAHFGDELDRRRAVVAADKHRRVDPAWRHFLSELDAFLGPS